MIITDILGIFIFGINHSNFAGRRILPSSMYDWGIASQLTYVAGALVLIGALWLTVERKIVKKHMIRRGKAEW